MRTLWVDSLDLDCKSLNAAHLLSRRLSEQIIHIRDTIPRATKSDIMGCMQPAGHQLVIPALNHPVICEMYLHVTEYLNRLRTMFH